jgi:signal transduction histidine kinase
MPWGHIVIETDTVGHEEQLRHQTTLAKFGELALKSDDLDEILTEACRLAGEALGTDLAKVVELQPDGKTLLVRAGVGWKPGVVGHTTIVAEHDTSEGHALRTGEPMISPDVAKETRFKYAQFLLDDNVQAVANVLIIGTHGRAPFGILQIDSRVPRQFTESDTLFLRSYANLIAGAVDRLHIMNEKSASESRLRSVLEDRVASRTQELTAANLRLVVEAEERERVEEALRQSLKMEAVGQLTGGLAHDFNNLLTGISANLELMRLRASQGKTADNERYIDAAMKSVNRAAALTHRLLAFSRRQTLDPTRIDVNGLIGGMTDLFARTVGPTIKVEGRFEPGLWAPLCDSNQLENALLNLVLNARDAMPTGGHLVIETRNSTFPNMDLGENVQPLRLPAGEYVGLFISDTGVGMSHEVIARAFDPFFTTKPLGHGTGLGLSMIYGFVQQSGGHIFLSSETTQGTRVSIYLPRHANAETAIEDPIVVARPVLLAADTVVLLVEDEVEVRNAVVEVLLDLGYTVLEAGDAPSALKIATHQPRLDLLLSDVGLPGGMNGRQLADAMLFNQPDLKVLFITGYAEAAAIGSGQMAPGMEVLTKPFTLEALSAKVGTLLNA